MLDMLHDVTFFSAYATVLEGDVLDARRRPPVELWKKRIAEKAKDNLDWSGENQLAMEDELEAKRRKKEHLSESEIDLNAQAEQCRDEDEVDRAKIKAKSGLENCSRM